MSDFKLLNLKEDVEDLAPKHGLAPNIESRFARVPLGLEQSGLSYYKMAPGFRLPFGHRHGEQEEVYVVLSGSARVNGSVVAANGGIATGARRGATGCPV